MPDLSDAASVWHAVLGRLQLQVRREHFDTFLRPCVGHSWETDDLIVAATSSFTVSWLEMPDHLELAREALAKTLGYGAGIRYRVLPSVAASDQAHQATVNAVTARPKSGQAAVPGDYDLGGRSVEASGYDWKSTNSATCNPKYNFANFVVGMNNQLAFHAACSVVADEDSSADTYNPLVVYAGPGLGKTHLLHAIGNRALRQNRAALYVTSEQFTNEFVSAINKRSMREFRDRYRNLDVLLMDDVQFLVGKEQTQESLFHTFNDLHQAGAQIVLTSDRAPQAIAPLEARLRSRFQWGLLADIQPPSLETRIAILHAWSSQQDEAVSDDILELIAHRVNRNVRELRGAFNRIIAMSQLMSMPMTVENVTHQLDAIAGPNTRRRLTPEQVLNQAALHYGITVEQILGRGRIASVAEARQIVMYLLTAELGITPTDAGRFLAGRNHSTVIHGSNKIRAAIATDDRIDRSVSSIKDALYS
jgi:chromosomal replication initiator protein